MSLETCASKVLAKCILSNMAHGHEDSNIQSTVNVHVANLIPYLDRTPAFEWYVVRHVSKNGCHKDMCLREIALCAQNMVSVLISIVDIIGWVYATV